MGSPGGSSDAGCGTSRRPNRRRGWTVSVVLLAVLAQGCTRPAAHEPVTLIYLDQRLVNSQFRAEYEEELQQFTQQTGIRVKALPHPESTQDQLQLWQSLLHSGPSGPDVYGIDVVWPSILREDFIDLKPYFADRVGDFFPKVIENFIVGGKLVAVPEGSDVGLLFYRKDLLEKYGFKHPPDTWDELEQMARRIQAGERAHGNTRFWGFLWPGVATEALTCSAMEWQSSQGGGRIIEKNGAISVNNPYAVRAWERAAHWVGTISPPGIVAYNEFDASNAWFSGEAAFFRNWPPAFVESQNPGTALGGLVYISPLPRGDGGHAGTLGGIGLGVSRSSLHPREAVQLVRFLTSPEMARRRALVLADAPSMPSLYDDPEVIRKHPHFQIIRQVLESGIVVRPSDVAGSKYNEVSVAYSRAIHSVLTGQRSAAEAAALLEEQLESITGLRPGPLLPTDRAAANTEKGKVGGPK